MPLTLFVPDFALRYRAAGMPRLPALERMLARAALLDADPGQGFPAQLFGLGAGEFSIAPFSRLGDGGNVETGYWLRADPVHLVADRDRLLLVPGAALDIRREEASALAGSFDGLYAQEGWHLEALAPNRWYLRGTRPLDVTTQDPALLVGSGILEFMPVGPDAAQLKQLMNETQMLFHDHPVNHGREEAGQPAINSIWLWGGGVLPKPRLVTLQQVFGGGPLLRGLAAWSGLQHRSMPEKWSDSVPAEDCLVELAEEELTDVDQRWFIPLLRSVKRGSIVVLDLYLGGLGAYRLTPSAARRFWRRGTAVAVAEP